MANTSITSEFVSAPLLEKIDHLFACKVGEYVDLPQLVVVGDQSSGKSSILEGLTGLPFPRDSGLCTRFATQITFRRSPAASINAFIIPSKGSSAEHIQKLKDWKKTDIPALDAPEFANVMKEATQMMEFDPTAGVASTFSEDVLRLEILGPSEQHFSVIDVPGIFKRHTQGLTTKEDITLVDNMVHGYMKNPRSVVLAVVPSNVDVATQEILERAEELDPDGIRTLGILTKPDLVDHGAELAIVDMVEGGRHQLRLGWHLVRNPGQADVMQSTGERSRLEETFFSTKSPWSQLEKERVGITALRKRLQAVLADHIRREFPKVKNEITKKLRTAEEDLKGLGPKRQTHSEFLQYISSIAARFQELARDAVSSNYGRADVFRDEDLRLATTAVNRAELFGSQMQFYGHQYQFESNSVVDEMENLGLEDLPAITTRTEKSLADLHDLVSDSEIIVSPEPAGIISWLRNVYTKSRGFELGTFNAAVLSMTMKKQASKWEDIAMGYVSDIVTMVHGFVLRVLQHVTNDERLMHSCESLLTDRLRERYTEAIRHTKFLLNVEFAGTPATHDTLFNERLQERRQSRVRQRLESRAIDGCQHGQVVKLEDIVEAEPRGNTDQIIEDIHDILESYYQVALCRFIDNVRRQVCDHFLVMGPDTPLLLFSPALVATLSYEQLEHLAMEDSVVKNRRERLEREIQQLQEGKRVLY